MLVVHAAHLCSNAPPFCLRSRRARARACAHTHERIFDGGGGPVCRRFCIFNPDTLTITWHASESSKALGEFVMDPLEVQAAPTDEHAKPFELRVRAPSVRA
ncbi:hypothetical protein EON67_09050 [archaeon]|nr:MAG: hypothetical protein EON67_09050 [archaeon]